MNKSHRSLWNPALRAWVAAPETARARGKGRHGATRAIVGCIGALVLGAGVPGEAGAQYLGLHGGEGGTYTNLVLPGGAGGTPASPPGSPGASGSSLFDKGGGGGGGGVSLSNGAGGSGGSGGAGGAAAPGGAGGAGGAAINTTQWSNAGPLTGMAGVDGGAGASHVDGAGGGGGGGGGGFGLVLSGTGPASNLSSIQGGKGGDGGVGGDIPGGASGYGGNGGGGAGGGGVLLLGNIAYRLHAGDASGAGESWFLRSSTPSAGAPSTAYRVEVPLFAALPAQLREGNLAMLGSLAQRRGDAPQRGSGGEAAFSLHQLALAPALAARESHERQAWARVLGSRLRIEHGGTVNPQSRGSLSGLQAGTDLWADAQWRVGLYLGQLDSDFDVQGFAQGAAGTNVGGNALRSRYLGAYATWRRAEGFYVDAVLQGGQHRYSVQPLTNPNARAEADSLSTSIEVGRSLPLQQGWQVEPQLQLVHQRTRFDDVPIAGANVQQERRGSWLLRAGLRIHGDLQTAAGRLRPHANVNLYRATGGHDSTLFSNPFATTTIGSRSGGNTAELAAGFALDVNPHASVTARLGKLWSLGGHQGVQSQWQASLGLRVHW